jgi:pseudouridine-5'-phosphate glycosidase
MGYHAKVFRVAAQLQEVLTEHVPVVALESTVITHGLPKPQNLELACKLEEVVRQAGAVPATVGVIGGELVVGLSREELNHLATTAAQKASLWNLPAILAEKQDAGTTVAATLHAAAQARISVFATGGIGGVHLEAFDESADLAALARYPLVVVCAGPKSILNVRATLERLESLGVPVIGYRSDALAGFHLPHTDLPVAARLESAEGIARSFTAQRAVGLKGAMLISNPVSSGLEPEQFHSWAAQAQREAQAQGRAGKDVTPYLLARLAELSGGESVTVNVRLLEENARLAASIARALSDKASSRGPAPARQVSA